MFLPIAYAYIHTTFFFRDAITFFVLLSPELYGIASPDIEGFPEIQECMSVLEQLKF